MPCYAPSPTPRRLLSRFALLVLLLLLAACAPRTSTAQNVGGVLASTDLPLVNGSITLSRGVVATPPPSSGPLASGLTKRLGAVRIDRISFYQAVAAQTDNDPTTAACGGNLGPWIQIAVSRDLLPSFPCGSLVRLQLDRPVAGIEWLDAIVYDTMNPRYRNTVDILVGTREPALRYGITSGVLYY